MKVGVIMGSDSDLPVMQKALDVFAEFGVECEVILASAHRTPDAVKEFAEGAEARGIDCIIAGAGMGVPLAGGSLKGMDALLATVQMPSGMPVATVAINGAGNGALLALQILAVGNAALRAKYKAYRKHMSDQVAAKNLKLQEQLKKS